jgi:hypothetical protein
MPAVKRKASSQKEVEDVSRAPPVPENDVFVATKLRESARALIDEIPRDPALLEGRFVVKTKDFLNATIDEQSLFISRPDWVDTVDNKTDPVLEWFSENAERVVTKTPS